MATIYDTLPIGVFLDASGVCTVRDANGSGTSLDASNVGNLRHIVHHPDVGLKPTGLNAICWTGQQPYNFESVQSATTNIESWTKNGPILQIASPYQKAIVTNGTGWDTWFSGSYDSGVHTRAAADVIAARYVTHYANHPSILAFNIKDDSNPDARSILCTQAMQAATGIPTANMWSAGFPAGLGTDFLYGLTYTYPCGKYSNNTPTAEGDFHRFTFSGSDWIDALRTRMDSRPKDSPAHIILQAHQTIDAESNNTELRYPTANEMRMQVWMALGENYKGLFWIAWTDGGFRASGAGSVEWQGLGNPASATRIAAASEMAHRITPEIRRKLVSAAKVDDEFVASGGGNATYPIPYTNAYISTLRQSNGHYLCIVVNHSASSAAITITAPGLTGRLVNLEDDSILRLGSAVTLPAFGGTIYELDPFIGVPNVDPDFSRDVKYYWDHHWANLDADEYIAPGDLILHSNTVTVTSGQDLQAVVDAAPDYTTFRLQAGTYSAVRLVGRSHLHFVADDDNNRPTVRSFYVYGCTHSQHINGENMSGIGGWVGKLINTPLAAERANFLNPKQDFIFRNLNFVSDGTLVDYRWYYLQPGVWTHDHGSENLPLFFRNTRDACVEGCTFSGYVFGDATTQPVSAPPAGVSPTPTQTGAVAYGDVGMISGNAGINHMVVRNCTFTAANRAGGTRNAPAGVFWDGACGCVSTDNTFLASPDGLSSWTMSYLFLTNDDFTMDAQNDGHADRLTDIRSARYNVCARTAFRYSSLFISWMGGNNLAIDNEGTVLANNSGSLAVFIEVSGRSTQKAAYDSTGNMVMNNITHGINWTGAFVDVLNNLGSLESDRHDQNLGSDGKIGRTTVTGNVVNGGTVANWIRTNGTTPQPATPDVVSGNTP